MTHARHNCVTMSYMSQDMAVGRVPELTLEWRLRMALGGMSTGEMADLLGVNRATVSRWMNGHGAPPRRAFVAQWALITGVDAVWLLTGEEPEGHVPGSPPTAGYALLPLGRKYGDLASMKTFVTQARRNAVWFPEIEQRDEQSGREAA